MRGSRPETIKIFEFILNLLRRYHTVNSFSIKFYLLIQFVCNQILFFSSRALQASNPSHLGSLVIPKQSQRVLLSSKGGPKFNRAVEAKVNLNILSP